MNIDQIAIQLFTLRDHLTTVDDVQATLEKVAAIGYRAVQVSGMKADIAPADLKQRCDDLGLTICSTHEPSAKIIEDPQAICDRLKALGCNHTAYPHPHVDLDTEDQVRDLAKQLDAAGKVFADNGCVLSYHNHAIEFRRFGPHTALDILLDATDPKHLEAELDLYWVQQGGGNPLSWIEKVRGRMQVVHLKDYGVPPGEKNGAFCEVGNGNLEWERIIPALDDIGTKWAPVEQDRCPGDPFVSITQSFNYLKSLLPTL